MYTEERTAIDMASQKVPTKGGDQDSPIRRKKMRITLAQKQALIDNLQLERKFARKKEGDRGT
jgi:hypothetical protein